MTLKLILLLLSFLLFCNSLFAQQLADSKQNATTPENTKNIKAGENKVLAKLIEMLKSDKEVVQLRAAELLADYGSEAVEAMELLAEKSDSSNEALRNAATIALNRIAGRKNIESSNKKESAENKKDNTAGTKQPTKVSGQIMDSNRGKVAKAEVQMIQDGKILETQIADDDGKFRFNTTIPENKEKPSEVKKPVKELATTVKENITQPADSSDKTTVTVRTNKEGFYETEQPAESASEIYLNPIKGRVGGETWRAVVGYEQAGASSQNSRRNLFFDFAMSVPLTSSDEATLDVTGFGPRLRAWGDVRLSSVPDPSLDEKSLKDFVIGFNETVANTKVGKVVQAFETTAGLEMRGFSPRKTFDGIFSGTRHSFSLNFIIGGGITAPLSPSDSDNKVVFVANDEARQRYGLSDDKTFIAFVSPDRDRFYRQYFAGIRLKTLYFDKYDRPINIHPANLDITFGQNEAITGGGLRGGILRFDGFYPLPIGKFNFLYLYGTAQMKLSRPKEFNTPLFLDLAPEGTSLNGDNTAIIPIPTINRDYYKIGIGVNPFKIFCLWNNICGDK